MTFADLIPSKTDRAFLCGKTGSGKSYAAERILRYVRRDDGSVAPRSYVQVFDAKGMLKWNGYYRVTSYAKLESYAQKPEKYPRVIYAPNEKELRDVDLHEKFFRLGYERRNVTVYVDEVFAVVRGQEYPDSYHALLTRGREMNVPIIGASQRPKDLPQAIMSESDCFYAFRLSMPQDRKRIASLVPVPETAFEPQRLSKREFWFYRDSDDRASGPWSFSEGSSR